MDIIMTLYRFYKLEKDAWFLSMMLLNFHIPPIQNPVYGLSFIFSV